MNRRRALASSALVLSFAFPAGGAPARAKLDPWLERELVRSAGGAVEALLVLSETADLSPVRPLHPRAERGALAVALLRATAERSQGPLRAELERRAIPYRPFFLVNMIWVKADAATLAELAARPEVERVIGNPRIPFAPPRAEEGPTPEAPAAVEWNVAKVNADDVWALGFTGVGAVVAGQDTGYDWDHPALLGKYRGWNGASANHDYDWHDAIHSGGGVCGANAVAPCDDHSHGTHTMGTMIGADGANQIGVAPGAKWIGCRNMDQGNGTPATYTECYEWFLAPTDLAGQNPNPALAPDVINNSWGCPVSEGCTDPNVMKIAVENLRAAGILSVHSAGNSGSSCASIDTPGAIYDASFTVGNTDSSDVLNSGSSRGAVTVDGSARRKPDISAPGTNIRSSVPGTGYQGGWSGTSMSGPHVAGVVALLIDADEALRGNVDALEELIRESAGTAVTATGTCGGIPASTVPNNHFGWGRIDALAAVQLRQSGFLFRDGFETGATDDWSATELGGDDTLLP